MADENRLIEKKTAWARNKRGITGKIGDDRPRLPPGQHLVKNFPVLDLGIQPDIDPDEWSLSIEGEIENPQTWNWDTFMSLPKIENVSDFHCVTTWSTYDNRWEGISFKYLLGQVIPKPEARFVYFTSYDNYSTNLPLKVLDDDDVLIAFKWNGLPLSKEHGGPVRMVVPKKYAWKSAKWVKEIIFMKNDQRGFWEVRGYSNYADPWKEERYSSDDD